MKRFRPILVGLTAVLTVGFAAVAASPASAATTNVFYDLDANDVGIGAGSCNPSSGSTRYADFGRLFVSEAGTYTFTDRDIEPTTSFVDGTLWIQNGNTCVEVEEAAQEVTFQNAGSYRVVMTSKFAGATGPFSFEITGAGNAFASLSADDPADYCFFGSIPSAYTVLFGTSKADRITGTQRPEVIFAGSGDDKVDGAGGNDVLCGQDGGDELTGGAGRDTLVGGNGSDRLIGGIGPDALYGNGGADRLEGGAGDDVLYGGQGADRLDGGNGFDGGFDSDPGSSYTGIEYFSGTPN